MKIRSRIRILKFWNQIAQKVFEIRVEEYLIDTKAVEN